MGDISHLKAHVVCDAESNTAELMVMILMSHSLYAKGEFDLDDWRGPEREHILQSAREQIKDALSRHIDEAEIKITEIDESIELEAG